MCLAATLHQSTYGYFPSGGWSLNWIGDPDKEFGESQPGGWCYSILPFLEQNGVYDLGKGLAQSRKIDAGTELAMCDGSVQWIRLDIKPEVHQMQSNRSDGGVTPR